MAGQQNSSPPLSTVARESAHTWRAVGCEACERSNAPIPRKSGPAATASPHSRAKQRRESRALPRSTWGWPGCVSSEERSASRREAASSCTRARAWFCCLIRAEQSPSGARRTDFSSTKPSAHSSESSHSLWGISSRGTAQERRV